MSHLMGKGDRPCGLPDGHAGCHRHPGYRDEQNARRRLRYGADQNYRQRVLAQQRGRYDRNPSYRPKRQDRWYAFTGPAYNLYVLKRRRQKALQRRADRIERGEGGTLDDAVIQAFGRALQDL